MLNASSSADDLQHERGLDLDATLEAAASAAAASASSWDAVALTICFVTLNIITIVSRADDLVFRFIDYE